MCSARTSTSGVTVATYETADATIESQVVNLKATGADVLILGTTPKFAAQAIRRVYDVGWKPHDVSRQRVDLCLDRHGAGGSGKRRRRLSSAYVKDPTDPAWADDEGVKQFKAVLEKYMPDGDIRDQGFVNGYNSAMAMEQVLKQCGDDLSPQNILKQALNLKGVELPMLLPGIKVDTSPTDHMPVEQMQMMRFDGKRWNRFGGVLSGS